MSNPPSDVVDETWKVVTDATQRTTDAGIDLRLKLTAIREVSAIIRKVAAQSRMLAINATIEAGRVSDASKGFSVVASEMWSLADQAESATGRIDDCLVEAEDAQIANDQAFAALREESVGAHRAWHQLMADNRFGLRVPNLLELQFRRDVRWAPPASLSHLQWLETLCYGVAE